MVAAAWSGRCSCRSVLVVVECIDLHEVGRRAAQAVAQSCESAQVETIRWLGHESVHLSGRQRHTPFTQQGDQVGRLPQPTAGHDLPKVPSIADLDAHVNILESHSTAEKSEKVLNLAFTDNIDYVNLTSQGS